MVINSYPKVRNLGHWQIGELFNGPIFVQEKVDGSQISFGVIGNMLHIRSKGATINPEYPQGMFGKAVDEIKKRIHKMPDGVIFRGEYLSKPKHNVLSYDKVPLGNIALFDVECKSQEQADEFGVGLIGLNVPPDELNKVSDALEFDSVPCIFSGNIPEAEVVRGWLDRESFLGGPKIEGIVFKNYWKFTPDDKVCMGKMVSDRFREVHNKEWKGSNSKNSDIIGFIIDNLSAEARWDKAVLHLRENGEITDSVRDIGIVIQEVIRDTFEECGDDMKNTLLEWASKRIKRGIVAGLPEWYKARLATKLMGWENLNEQDQ